MNDLYFKDWESLQRVALAALTSFIILFIFIRIAGKRTMSKFNAFDFVVTVTLGSTLSWMIIAQISIAEGALASAIIIALQYVLAKTVKASKSIEKIVNSSPIVVFYDGKYIPKAMEDEYLTYSEVRYAIRKEGYGNIEEIKAVIMEPNGDMTVIPKQSGSTYSAMEDVDVIRNYNATDS